MRKLARAAGSSLLALILLFLGYAIFNACLRLLTAWPSIGGWYRACVVAWLVAAPAMFLGGLWILGSLGRHRIPLWIAGGGAVLAGTVLVGGVLAYVIPCSGPS